ncbi:MAG: hypothetical protein AAFX75_14560 [Pseudomonadota bacterium]
MTDPTNFSDPIDQALCILHTESMLTPAEVSRKLLDDHGVNVHWKTIDAAFRKNKSFVTRRKKNHKFRYSILADGKERINAVTTASTEISFVDPTKAVQNVVTLHDTLSAMSGRVRVCDPYLDATSIEHLDSCANDIQYLTHNISDSGLLRQLIAAYKNPTRSIEVRRTGKNVLHDRYIIDKGSMLILGTSLNGFGKKHSFMIRGGRDIRTTMLKAFDQNWHVATQWPPKI